MNDALIAAGVIFLAELGDKTQLVVIGAGVRHRRLAVFAALAAAVAVLAAVAATAGAAVDRLLPDRAVGIGTGLLFLAFAWTTWTGRHEERGGAAGLVNLTRLVLAFAAAELGDKSMLGTASLAADRGLVEVWIGATVGESAVVGLSLLAGGWLAARVSPDFLRRIGAAAFVLVGLASIIGST